MGVRKPKPGTVDEYIHGAPEHARKKLREIRSILKSVAPKAKEDIKWGVPVLEGKRILFSFSAARTHITFMPTGPSMEPFKKELEKYSTGKDTIQFAFDKPLPKTLIRKIAAHRMKEVKTKDAKWMYK